MTDASSMPWRRDRGRADAGVLRPLAPNRRARFSASLPRAAIKRAFDIVASAALVVFTLPLLAAVGLAVRLDGPVFHRQERVGLGLDLAILWRTAVMVFSPGRAADAVARPAVSAPF
ncbi:MAG: sugar transferase [Alphaproteobacteria bacterium]